MADCIIDGVQCTACCRAITLRQTRKQLITKHSGSDFEFALKNFKQLKRRLAKKINPYVVKRHNAFRKSISFYQCSKVTNSGCSVYESRPRICSAYPLYGASEERFTEHCKTNPPEYHPKCTQWIIPVKEVDSNEP